MDLSTTGWNSLSQAQPIDPLSIIANCSLGGAAGVWERSTTFLQPRLGTNTVAYTGNNTTLVTLNPTDASTIAWAAQWDVQTKMVNVGASINAAISKVAFIKAGSLWDNQIEIGFGGQIGPMFSFPSAIILELPRSSLIARTERYPCSPLLERLLVQQSCT